MVLRSDQIAPPPLVQYGAVRKPPQGCRLPKATSCGRCVTRRTASLIRCKPLPVWRTQSMRPTRAVKLARARWSRRPCPRSRNSERKYLKLCFRVATHHALVRQTGSLHLLTLSLRRRCVPPPSARDHSQPVSSEKGDRRNLYSHFARIDYAHL